MVRNARISWDDVTPNRNNHYYSAFDDLDEEEEGWEEPEEKLLPWEKDSPKNKTQNQPRKTA